MPSEFVNCPGSERSLPSKACPFSLRTSAPFVRHAWRWLAWLVIALLMFQAPAPALIRASPPGAVSRPAPVPSQQVAQVALAPSAFPLARPEAAPAPAPAQAQVPGIKVYEKADVNCANPQYPEASLPFHEEGEQATRSKYLYICSEGADAHVALFAGALGYGPGTSAYLKCYNSGGCSGFAQVAPEAMTLWQNSPYACKHVERSFEQDLYLPAGKYTLFIYAGNSGSFHCDGRTPWYELRLDVSGSQPSPDRTLSGEDACNCNNPDGYTADPVNTRTGNFTHQEVDITIPTRGLPLTFERSYNSRDLASGPLGRGWTHNYSMRLITATVGVSQIATLVAPHGARLRFTQNGNGSFSAGPGVRASLIRQADGHYTVTRGDQAIYTFDAAGRLVSLADKNGNTTTLSYTANRLTAITAPDGRALQLAYDGQGRLSQLTDPISRTVSYTYTTAGRSATVIDRGGGQTTYGYNPDGYLATLTDPTHHTVTNTYDIRGRVLTQTNTLGQATTFAYGSTQTLVTNPRGYTMTHAYSQASGLLTSITDALGNTTQYTFDQDYNPVASTDPLGRVTQAAWNGSGCNYTSRTDPLGHATTLTYGGSNYPLSQTDPLSRTTHYTYDAHYNATAQTDALGRTTRYAYDDYGHVISTTDAANLTTRYGYDEFGQRVVITDPAGLVTRYGYDAVGRLITTTAPGGLVTVNQYPQDASGRDNADHLIRVTRNYTTAGGQNHLNAYNLVTRYAYDQAGRQVAVTDTLGYVNRSEYPQDAYGATRLAG